MAKGKGVIFTVTNDLSFDQRMQRIAGVLYNNGFDVELIGRKRKQSIPLNKVPYKQKRLTCIFDHGKLFYIEFNLRLFFYLLFSTADVYCAVDLDTILPCTLVAKLKRSKLIFDAHEYYTEVPELAGRETVKRVWQTIADLCIPATNKAYTVGPELASLFSKQYNIPFDIILNVPFYKPLKNEAIINNIPVIFYQGALNTGRGLPQLIKAMSQINGILKIAGEGDLSDELRLLVKQLHLEMKVEFLGFILPADLQTITLQATIACNLLEPNGLSYQYSLANKFFDYMHAGIPQLCADFIEYRHINSKYKIAVFCSCNVDDIVTQINKLLANKDLYLLLKQNCAKAAQVYNLQSEEKKILEIYQSLFA